MDSGSQIPSMSDSRDVGGVQFKADDKGSPEKFENAATRSCPATEARRA